MVRQLAGINLHLGKRELVRARLAKRLRTLGMERFDQYLEYVAGDDGNEVAAMLDALSTNLTYFFREPRHFDVLKETVVPEMLASHRDDRRLRIWCAGCSSGEEPYSIAIVLKEAIPDLARWDVGILATDLSTQMLRAAREGIYTRQRLGETSAKRILENFERPQGRGNDSYRITGPAKDMVQFARLNFMDPWPMRGPLDAIFCRNVMIYFDKETQHQLIDRFWNILAPRGVLFVGHSESLTGLGHRFQYVEPTVYRKIPQRRVGFSPPSRRVGFSPPSREDGLKPTLP
jgi:chemotaxis protein methyltransferase CheR